MDYVWLKHVHVGCVVLSGSLFALRAGLMLLASPWLQHPVLRTLPHAVDTVLLSSAIAMAVIASLNPLQQDWLGAKVLALLAYIVLGSVALKRGKTLAVRGVALLAAVATFGYIVMVALRKNPWWW